ncbi:MAG: hypothetical protein Q7J98_05475, partial [Kiritimatiellia bacterium]|nr:hypothetical protein [Kiritimatiellia bacterium]
MMNEERRAFLTEPTEFIERGESRTDVADKFLRYAKFIGHIFSVFSVSSPLKAGQASELVT